METLYKRPKITAACLSNRIASMEKAVKAFFTEYLRVFFILFLCGALLLGARNEITTFVVVFGSIFAAIVYNIILPEFLTDFKRNKDRFLSALFYVLAQGIVYALVSSCPLLELRLESAWKLYPYAALSVMVTEIIFLPAFYFMLYILYLDIKAIFRDFRRYRILCRLPVNREDMVGCGVHDRISCLVFYDWVLKGFGKHKVYLLDPADIPEEKLKSMQTECAAFPINTDLYESIKKHISKPYLNFEVEDSDLMFFVKILRETGQIQEDFHIV